MNKTLLAHTFLLLANLIYAINYTFAKDVMPDYIQPSGFILLRVTGALTIFSVFYFFIVNEFVERRDVFKLALCAVFGVAINQLLFFEGLNLSTPINAAIVMTTNPILVIIFSFLLIKEVVTFRKIIGVFFGLFGASILILKGGSFDMSSNLQLGNVFVFINAASYGLYLVIVRPMMQKYHPITVMFYVFVFGFLYVLPFGYNELSLVQWNNLPLKIIWQIVFVVLCTTVLAYLLNSVALKQLNPSVVSIYIYLQPLLATVFAILRGADTLDKSKITSIILIFIGVYLVSVRSIKQRESKLS